MHGQLSVVKRLVEEVTAVSGSMLESLLARLQGAIQLPECLRVIGYLRRLATFSGEYCAGRAVPRRGCISWQGEPPAGEDGALASRRGTLPSLPRTLAERELRLQFLARREAWVAGLVAELDPGGSAYEYLKRLTDIYRLHLFDVVMQFGAIFSDEPVSGSSAGSSAGAAGGMTRAHSLATRQAQREHEGSGILHEWAQRRVVAYLEAMRAQLPRVSEGGSLASVLDHAMYCGMSLGRVGMDFRPLLAPLFEARVLDMFASSMQASTDTLALLLESHKWIAMPALAARGKQAGDGAVTAGGGGAGEGGGGEATGPPYSLMEHPPLAIYTNGLLAAFNELRHCAPLTLRDPVAAALQGSLAGAATVLAHQGSTHALGEGERAVFDAACRAFTSTLCPYVASCLAHIYGQQAALLLDLRAAATPLTELAPGGH